MSAPPVKLHMGSPRANALLDPIRLELNRTEIRLQNYLDRLDLTDDDATLITRAKAIIADAASGITALHEEASHR